MGILELTIKYEKEKAAAEASKKSKAEGEANGIELTLKVIELLKQKISPSKIAKELNMDLALVKKIAASQK